MVEAGDVETAVVITPVRRSILRTIPADVQTFSSIDLVRWARAGAGKRAIRAHPAARPTAAFARGYSLQLSKLFWLRYG